MATSPAFKQDIQAMYALAAQCDGLASLVPALCDVLRRNEASLTELTYSYRLAASDTGYRYAFALVQGRFAELEEGRAVDVTVTGLENNLLAVFQRKLNPAAALLLGKIKLNGDKAALLKLAAFL